MSTSAERAGVLAVIALFGCGKAPKEQPSATAAEPTMTTVAPSAPPPVATFDDAAAAPPEPSTRTAGLFGGDPAPSASASARARGAGATYEKAREAALAGRYGEVRALLETKVRSGHASSDEARLVREACKQMRDAACKDDVDAKYSGPR